MLKKEADGPEKLVIVLALDITTYFNQCLYSRTEENGQGKRVLSTTQKDLRCLRRQSVAR